MFSYTHRLTKKKDIELTLKEGQRRSGIYTQVVFWLVQPEKYPTRGYHKTDLKTAVIVGKKVSKKAVVRNRVKRQYREILKQAVTSQKIRPGAFCICLVKPSAVDQTTATLKKDFYALFEPRKK